MAAMGDLIDFDVIEGSKENIQQLPSGRSAKALHAILSPVALKSPSNTQDIHDGTRQQYEREVASIDDSDDPLDVYDRYVKWTMDAYPSAQSTPQSQLLPLLERATKTFLAFANYKNDLRYLKLWLLYIRLFSDAPRETFAYLARHGIGETLALYYEEFAAWLEGASRWHQAEEMYRMGLVKEAQPAARLARKFADFEKRYQARPEDAAEPSSPALPTVRPALVAKLDPFASATAEAAAGADPQAVSRANAATKSKKAKLAIFSDSGEDERPASGGSSRGWDNIGTIAERKKENTISARPMAGETLKSGTQQMGVPKMAIFKDESKSRLHSQAIATDHPARDQKTVNVRTGKLERVFVNLEAIYPNRSDPSEEYCFEELRAAKRGWLSIDWNARRAAQAQIARPADKPKKTKAFEIKRDDTLAIEPERIRIVTQQQTLALNDENAENVDPEQAQVKADFAKKLACKEEKANRTKKIKLREETKTVQTNLNSPNGPKIRKKKSKDPTMTMQSKLATDEVYDLFNQPMESVSLDSDDGTDGSSSEDDDDDDYTSGGESVTGGLSAAASDFGDETRRDVEGDATATGWTTFDPKAILAGREHEIDDTTTHTDMTTQTETTTHTHETTQDVTGSSVGSADSDHADASDAEDFSEEVVTTPISPTPGEQSLPTRYVPIPPEGWEARVGPYRDPSQVAQNRLPFMTPIVEKTESSLGATTGRRDQDYFSAKTPCPKASGNRRTPNIPEDLDHDELMSSPFESMIKTESRQSSPPPKMSLLEHVLEASLAVRAKSSVQEASAPKPPRVQKGPIILDAQINPMDETVRATILREMQPPLSSYDGYHYHGAETSSRRPDIKRFCKALSAKTTPSNTPVLSFAGSERQYQIKRDLGAGAYATLYLVESTEASVNKDDNDDDAPAKVEMGCGAFASRHRRPLEALKMEDPPSAWEFYMLSLAHRRLGINRAAASIVRAHELHLYADECFLIEDYRPSGTLLDLVNGAGAMGVAQETASEKGSKGVDEMLAMFLAAELLRTVEALHAKGIVHGDLKPDNVLLRLGATDTTEPAPIATKLTAAAADDAADAQLASHYRADGSGGWSARGIALIDFGRAINMAHFTPGVQFVADWATGATDCAEMREARPWTHQVDYFGLANCVHTLLFGRYIETLADKQQQQVLGGGGVKTYRLREGLKRYWQTEIWSGLFAALLNPGRVEGGEGTMQERVARKLRECRESMEAWLEGNGERGVGLRGMLRRVEGGVAKRR